MNDNSGTSGIDIAVLFTNEADAAVCFVQMPRKAIMRFESIGRDEDGPYLVNDAGGVLRIGAIDKDSFDEALELPNFRLSLMDETGLFVEEYDIKAIKPENGNAYGA